MPHDPVSTYLQYLVESGARASTVTETRRVLGRFDAWRGGREVTNDLLADYRGALARQQLKPSTRNKVLTILKCALTRTMRRYPDAQWNTGTLDPFQQDHKAIRVLTQDDVRAIWAACEGSDIGKTVRALLLTGMRHQELLHLKTSDLTEHGILVRCEVAKNRKARLIPWCILHDVREHLLPPFSWSRGGFEAIRKASGVNFTPKDLRSTFVTYAWSRGAHPAQHICQWAGHTLGVAEARYVGIMLYGLTGDTVAGWYGLNPVATVSP